METQGNERVICPGCGKAYRWKPTLVGQLVPCKKCNTEFIVPREPGKGERVQHGADNDDSVYALAMDIDEVTPAPPPPPRERKPPPPPAETPAPASSSSSSEQETSEPEVPREVSEAVKAQRREEQRRAAAANTTKSWRDYKTPIFLIGGATLIIIILLVLIFVSDALDGILG